MQRVTLSCVTGLSLMALASLQGCGERQYPNLGRISDTGPVMSSDEQKQVIDKARKDAGVKTEGESKP